MFTFIWQRLIIGGLSMLVVISLISAVMYMAPVDAASLQFGHQNNEQSVLAFKQINYLDRPLWVQVFYYLCDLSPLQWVDKTDARLTKYKYYRVYGNENRCLIIKMPYFRESFVTRRPVADLLKASIPRTLILGCASIIIAVLIGVSLGVLAAMKKDSIIDYVFQGVCTAIYAVPSYVSAIVLSLVFGFILYDYTRLPVQGSLVEYNDFGELEYRWRNLILPALALGLRPVSQLFLITRTSLLDVMQMDFVRTARSKGLPYLKVLTDHVFPNSLNPIMTTVSSWFASMLTGAFFVEYVFNYRGMGDLSIQALNQLDIPVILACSVVTIVIFVFISIATDICYALSDPRIKISD